MKIYIIQNIDKKIPLDTIARGKGLNVDEVLDEMETIVQSGTKLNLNYYVNDMLPREQQEELFDYFREADSDSVEAALEELGDDNFSRREVKMMRLKFLSDMGI